jgi:ESCRT-II complex subunit VPS25
MTTLPEDKSFWWQFKPLFTLQPVKATRDKQLKLWNELIIRHCREHKLVTIHPQSFPLFRNEAIDRQMSEEGISAVVEYMVANGTV